MILLSKHLKYFPSFLGQKIRPLFTRKEKLVLNNCSVFPLLLQFFLPLFSMTTKVFRKMEWGRRKRERERKDKTGLILVNEPTLKTGCSITKCSVDDENMKVTPKKTQYLKDKQSNTAELGIKLVQRFHFLLNFRN